MDLTTLDVVAVLPPDMRRAALALGDRLIRDMRARGFPSHFRLGAPYDGADPCEPHVSIFMLAVDAAEVADVVAATRRVAGDVAPLSAEGRQYRHNPAGAPELYFRKTAAWIDLQRRVVDAVEPLRRGRLRETDPAGDVIGELLDDPRTDPARRRQLARYGYDEVTRTWPAPDPAEDRFNPHVTLAWPVDPEFRIGLSDLPPARDFSGTLPGLAVYGMSRHGTCTTRYDVAPFGGSDTPNGASTLDFRSTASTGRK